MSNIQSNPWNVKYSMGLYLSTPETTSYTYDLSGNLTTQIHTVGTQQTTKTYQYDHKNRMIAFKDPAGKVSTYAYYPDGLRSQKTVNGATTQFYYAGADIIDEAVGGQLYASNIRGFGLIGRSSGSHYYTFIRDGHGDVNKILDETGAEVSNYQYDAYGNEIKTGAQTNTLYNPYRYSGEYYDEESGLYYLRARYYSPEIARFITQDTFAGNLQQPLSLNLYAYCNGNPLRYVDPSGHCPEILKNIVDGFYNAGSKIYDVMKMFFNKASGVASKGTSKTGATTVSENGLNFIANHEVNINTLLLDDKGKILGVKTSINNTTIGYGYDLTQDPLSLGIGTASTISAKFALELLTGVANNMATKIVDSPLITIQLSQQQLDALVALRYNVGSLNVIDNLIDHINTGASYEVIKADIDAYYDEIVSKNPENAKYRQGWQNRTDEILNLYFNGDYGVMPLNVVEGVYK